MFVPHIAPPVPPAHTSYFPQQPLHVPQQLPKQQIGLHKRVPTNEQSDLSYTGNNNRSPSLYPQQRNSSMPPVFLSSQPTPDLSSQQPQHASHSVPVLSNRISSPFLRPGSSASGGEARSASPSKLSFDPFTGNIPTLSKESLVSTAGTSFSTLLDGIDRTLSVSPASSSETLNSSHTNNIVNNSYGTNSLSASTCSIPPIGTRSESANSQHSSRLMKDTQLQLPSIPAFNDDFNDDDDDLVESGASRSFSSYEPSSTTSAIGMPTSTAGSGSVHNNPLSWSKVWGSGAGTKSSSGITTTSVWG